MSDLLTNVILTVVFLLTDLVLYFYLATKYKTYNPLKIANLWIKEYM